MPCMIKSPTRPHGAQVALEVCPVLFDEVPAGQSVQDEDP